MDSRHDSAQSFEKQSSEIKGRGGSRQGAGRPVGALNKATSEVRELAAAWGPEAIQQAATLAGLVRDKAGIVVGQAESEQARIAALSIILDRAYGRPSQVISATVHALSHEEILALLE